MANDANLSELPVSHSRIAYIDNLKWLTIILVVIMHAAVTYSGMGAWYYEEAHNLDLFSRHFFEFFQSHLQAYFMSLFFMIAAYFVPRSLEKKGAKKFIQDRLIRLGIPTLIYMLIINPVVMQISYSHGADIPWDGFKNYITSFAFIFGTGPMWFALVLLIFSIFYCAIDHTITRLTAKFSFAVNVTNISILIAVITLSAFAIRLIYPIGTSVMNLQFCFFAAYIFMFMVGIIAYKKSLLEQIGLAQVKLWFTAILLICVPIWLSLSRFFINNDGSLHDVNAMIIKGGWNLPAFVYAFWESFFCVAFIIVLLGVFRRFFNTQNNWQKFLSDNAFGVYVFHPLVLVSVSVLIRNLTTLPILKFLVVAAITVPLSFVLAALIRKVPILHKLFS